MRGRRNHVSRSNDSKAAHKMRRGQADAARQAGLCESGVDVASAVADQRNNNAVPPGVFRKRPLLSGGWGVFAHHEGIAILPDYGPDPSKRQRRLGTEYKDMRWSGLHSLKKGA